MLYIPLYEETLVSLAAVPNGSKSKISKKLFPAFRLPRLRKVTKPKVLTDEVIPAGVIKTSRLLAILGILDTLCNVIV